MRFANTFMTIDEQVAFAWKHHDHFEAVRLHNLENLRGPVRNAWVELADAPDAKADRPNGSCYCDLTDEDCKSAGRYGYSCPCGKGSEPCPDADGRPLCATDPVLIAERALERDGIAT